MQSMYSFYAAANGWSFGGQRDSIRSKRQYLIGKYNRNNCPKLLGSHTTKLLLQYPKQSSVHFSCLILSFRFVPIPNRNQKKEQITINESPETMTTPKPTILLTGANGGLGIGYVQNLLKSPYATTHNAIYTVRNPSTATNLSTLLSKSAPKLHSYSIIALDFNSLANVRKVASELNESIEKGEIGRIQALVFNAGWQEANASTLKPQSFTEEGYEAHFGINYLAQFLFVLLLLGSMDRERGRVVMVSSFAHNADDPRAAKDMKLYMKEEYKEMFQEGGAEEWAKGIEYKDDGYLGGMRRYGASKLGGVMFM